MTVGMRVALKIAYAGGSFYGHQRQPDARTVEGECLVALKAAKILGDPREAFFRSASRTDRGVSAVGNVIAFNTRFPDPESVVGAFNDRSWDVFAWAAAEVPDTFHPRHAVERWYRYHVFEDLPLGPLKRAASLFVGDHDVQSFTSDPPRNPFRISHVDVAREDAVTLIDVRAPSFRRGMVRRIVSAVVGHARGDVSIDEISSALSGAKTDFGTVPPEPLFLMDVVYSFSFQVVLKPKVRDDWVRMRRDAALRSRLIRAWQEAARAGARESL